MHCLRWWLPLFLLPLPAASPFMMLLFVVTYAIRTKPCAYCSVIILGLLCSTCAFYSVWEPMQDEQQSSFNTLLSSSLSPSSITLKHTNARTSSEPETQRRLAIASSGEGARKAKEALMSPLDHTTQQHQHRQSASSKGSWSSCWIDLGAIGGSTWQDDDENHAAASATAEEDWHASKLHRAASTMGWWSAPAQRRRPTALRQWTAQGLLGVEPDRKAESTRQTRVTARWRTWLNDVRRKGLLVGMDERSGYRIKLFVD